MAKNTINKTKITLQKIFKERGITLNKIILFGSYANENETSDSDIDLIVVSRDLRNKDIFEKIELTRGIHRILVNKIKRPFDILYYSDIDWNKGCSIIINEAKKKGQVLYNKMN